jgi:hypothetical protein
VSRNDTVAMITVAAVIRPRNAAGGSDNQPKRLIAARSPCVSAIEPALTTPQSVAAWFQGTDAKMTSPEACA